MANEVSYEQREAKKRRVTAPRSPQPKSNGPAPKLLGWGQWLDQKKLEAGFLTPEDYDKKYPLTEEQKKAPTVVHRPKPRTFMERASESAAQGFDMSPAGAVVREARTRLSARDATRRDTGKTKAERLVAARRDNALKEKETLAEIAIRNAGDPADDPLDYVADFGGGAVGYAAGDPTTLLMPGKTVAQRIAAQAAISGGVDAGVQGVEIAQGVRDEIDPVRVGVNVAAGAGGQSVGELIGAGLKARRAGVAPEAPRTPLVDDTPLSGAPRAPEDVPDAVAPYRTTETPEAANDPAMATRPTDDPDPVVRQLREYANEIHIDAEAGAGKYNIGQIGAILQRLDEIEKAGRIKNPADLEELGNIRAFLEDAATIHSGRQTQADIDRGYADKAPPASNALDQYKMPPEIATQRPFEANDQIPVAPPEPTRIRDFIDINEGRVTRDDVSVGGIGPGQGVVPDRLTNVVNPEKQPRRPREETQKAGDDLPPDDYDVGDVAAKAARSSAEAKAAGDELLKVMDEFGPQSDEYLEALTKLDKAIQKHSDNSSNLGRGLSTLNDADATSAKAAMTLRELEKKNPVAFHKLAQRYADDPDALVKIARDSVDPTWRDRIFSFRYNMMLSGWKTHVYNILGTAGNIAMDFAEHGMASALGQRRRWSGDLDRVTGRELASRIVGMGVGARQGLAAMKTAFREGRTADDLGKNELNNARVGKLQVPVKAMAAEDEFFRNVASMSEVYGQAVRKAVGEGLTGAEYKARVDDLIKNPTPDMLKTSKEASKRMRFQDDPSFIGKSLESWRRTKPTDNVGVKGLKDVAALIMPFVRTPDSLIRTAIRRSPLGLADDVNIKDWKAGGARRDLAVARVATGTAVVSAIAGWVFDGEITGEGPRDYKKRQQLELTGWQPNSIKIGDKYYSYAGLEPLSYLLNGTATTIERWDEGVDKTEKWWEQYIDRAATQPFNALEVMTNSSYLEGLSELFAVMQAKPEMRDAQKNTFFANIAQSFVVPAVVRQTNQTFFDPIQRDTRGDDDLEDRIVGRIQSGIPGLSDDLPAQLDALGRPMGHGEALGPDWLSRMTSPLTESTPVADELVRLMGADPEGKTVLDRVARTVNSKDFPMGRLTAQEHHNYQLVTGTFFDAMMAEEMAKPEYKTMSDDDKRALVKEVAADAREFAREEVFSDPNGQGPETAEEPIETGATAEDGDDFPFGVPTSMRRTEAGNKAVGGVEDSQHLSGDAIDFVPAPGVSWQDLYEQAQDFFGPDATVLWEHRGTKKEHVHVQLPGLEAPYYGDEGTQ